MITLNELINSAEKSPYTLAELQGLVIDWAKDKELIKADNSHNQYMKILEEYGEVCSAILKLEKNGVIDLIDGIGDVMVTLSIILAQLEKKQFLGVSKADMRSGNIYSLHSRFIENYAKHDYYGCAEIIQSIAHLYNLNPIDCLYSAYRIISKRKGTTVNGTFIKEEEETEHLTAEIENELTEPEID